MRSQLIGSVLKNSLANKWVALVLVVLVYT